MSWLPHVRGTSSLLSGRCIIFPNRRQQLRLSVASLVTSSVQASHDRFSVTSIQPEVLEYEKANGETEHRETRFEDSSSLAAATTHVSKKGSSRYASSTTGLEHVEANKKLERKLVRKLGQFKSWEFYFPPY